MWSKPNRETCICRSQITCKLCLLVTIHILCLSILVIFICLQWAPFYYYVGLLIDSAETDVRWWHEAFHAWEGACPLFLTQEVMVVATLTKVLSCICSHSFRAWHLYISWSTTRVLGTLPPKSFWWMTRYWSCFFDLLQKWSVFLCTYLSNHFSFEGWLRHVKLKLSENELLISSPSPTWQKQFYYYPET